MRSALREQRCQVELLLPLSENILLVRCRLGSLFQVNWQWQQLVTRNKVLSQLLLVGKNCLCWILLLSIKCDSWYCLRFDRTTFDLLCRSQCILQLNNLDAQLLDRLLKLGFLLIQQSYLFSQLKVLLLHIRRLALKCERLFFPLCPKSACAHSLLKKLVFLLRQVPPHAYEHILGNKLHVKSEITQLNPVFIEVFRPTVRCVLHAWMQTHQNTFWWILDNRRFPIPALLWLLEHIIQQR